MILAPTSYVSEARMEESPNLTNIPPLTRQYHRSPNLSEYLRPSPTPPAHRTPISCCRCLGWPNPRTQRWRRHSRKDRSMRSPCLFCCSLCCSCLRTLRRHSRGDGSLPTPCLFCCSLCCSCLRTLRRHSRGDGSLPTPCLFCCSPCYSCSRTLRRYRDGVR